ncbi:MAG TPA: nucleoside-diphosphate sugar epimerase, partial [Candidatus Binatia bacterium]|nr:nucleoside-diphosphate sugar epimerase [Candidatus Binatia bacterium]
LTISNLTKSRSTIEYGAERPGDVKHSVAGVDKIQTAGFRPVCDLAGGLRATIEFVRKNIASIEQGFHL